MTLSKEATQLEKLRQEIEQAEYESGDASDFLDRGNPNDMQKKEAQTFIIQKNAEAAGLKLKLSELIKNTPTVFIEEWINYHLDILQTILAETSQNTNAGTRKFVAENTLKDWQAVRAGKKDYVGINWYFLKDYRERVRNDVNSNR